MKTRSTSQRISFFLKLGIFIGVAIANRAAHAVPTIWTGPTTNFAQTAVPLGSPPVADVLIPGHVSLARNGNHWLYNTNVDLFGAQAGTPSDTEWAFGVLNNFASLTYQSFDSFRNFDLSGVLLNGGPMVVHLINEDIYLSVHFTAWPHGGGLIAYTRSTPAVVVTPPTPSVTITNPANGAVFAEPADVTIGANATVSSGTVTNVTFFSNGTPLGSRQAPPFTITANGLTNGSYALAAVATAGGISATSAVVNISVITSPTVSVTITNPADGAVFASPANVTIGANATVSSGTVTNVTFFTNATLFGSTQTAPFTIIVGGLNDGAYTLQAVATAGGISATSSVVNISVVTPPPTSLSTSPAAVTDNQFSFSYNATPGLRYEVDISSNLINWTPLVTNVAASSVVFITNDISGGGNYYRVGRLPNQ